MPNIRDSQFWREQGDKLREEFIDLTMRIMLAGADAGAEMLPAGIDVLINWDTFNESALDWMQQYFSLDPVAAAGVPDGAFRWAQQLTDTTRKTVVSEIDNWIREGAPLPTLEKRLEPLFGKERAKRVAVTEVTRVYAAGNINLWKSNSYVTGHRWTTARDERVCPICGPLHNTLVDIDKSWEFNDAVIQQAGDENAQKALRNVLKSTGRTIRRPPAHVNCRCYLQPVLYETMTEEEIEGQKFGGKV